MPKINQSEINDVARRMARERFQLPDGADFYSLHAQRDKTDIGERMNIALAAIEEANKAKLEGVFREVDFNSESKLGQTRDRNARLKLLLEDFATPKLDLRPSVVGEEDVIGNVYEYLLERFASDAGKKAGEFYTPGQVSKLLAILLFNKGKTHGDVLFIDASREFKDAKNQNVLTDEHLEKIVTTHKAFQTVEKYAYRATAQEIADNDFNLNIPRYVDTFEEEAEIDLGAVKKEIAQLEGELATVRQKMDGYLKELGL